MQVRMRVLTLGVWLSGLLIGTIAQAATVKIGPAEVQRTLITQGADFGGCMVMLNVDLQEQGADCSPAGWVSFSCTGDFMDRDRAWRMMDSAQMAKALDLRVGVWVNDHQKHNGHCVVDRIDVLP